jgi:sensor domain CHASE-containing protein
MTTDQLRDPVGKTSLPQVVGADRIVVDHANRFVVHAFLLQKVTDIVQQRRDDHFRVAARITGKLRALQRMFQLRDRLPKVCQLAGRFQQFHDLIHASFRGDGHHRNILSETH